MFHYVMKLDNVVMPLIHQWTYGYQRKGRANPLHKNKPIPDNVIYLDQYREEKGVYSREGYGAVDV